MKISEGTLSVLKNFSLINPSILFKPGNEISTISSSKTILSTATVDETFPVKGAIYNLNRFLGVLSLFEDPELTFDEHRVTISEGAKNIRYTFTDEKMVVVPPDRTIEFPVADASVEVPWKELNDVMRACAVMDLPEVALVGEDGKISICAMDTKNPTADNYSSDVGETSNTFKFIFKVENLKLMNYNYLIEVTAKGIAKFTSINQYGPKVVYFIATEAKSEFNGA